jgi:c(7)-type cytochrome triheme protein
MHERRQEGEHMNRIWYGLMGLFLLVSPAWAVIGGGDIIFQVDGMASVLFSHDSHVGKAKLKCAACHPALYKNRTQHIVVGMANMQKGKSCGACHDGKKAFGVVEKKDCEKCHVNNTTKY